MKPTTSETRRVFIGLGSNIGSRAETIGRALQMLAEEAGPIVRCSDLIATRPEGFRSSHPFLNGVCLLTTTLEPTSLLRVTQDIERRLGRRRKSRNGQHFDRPIDIDLLWMEGVRIDTPELSIPHKHIAERRFVLEPWSQIAPDHRLTSDGPTIAEMLQQLMAQTPTNDPSDKRIMQKNLVDID
ncbi:MAG: 2-amino-4-hydroxy-6-hydroxymethyldihydropteridine diphosphokinase [Alloprevotella sp.]|nr:2-amino-4-hydroxy-6-hydroxymethyldihydropteridine diphosphokinase [Alloprevotella sp.]